MNARLVTRILTLMMLLVLVFPARAVGASESTEDTPEMPGPDAHFSIRAHGDFSDEFFRDVAIAPGDTVTLELLVSNWDDKLVDLYVFNTNALNAHNGGFIPGEVDEEQFGATPWVDFPMIELRLEADEQLIVPFEVTVPEGTSPGQYFSALVANTVETFPIPGDELIDYRLQYSITISILVPGEIEPSFTLGPPTIEDQTLLIPVINTGNYLVQPQGSVEIFDGDGSMLLEFPVQMGSVYTGIETSIEVWLPSSLPEGDYTLSASLIDTESGESASLNREDLTMINPGNERAHRLAEATVDPNDVDIVFANVSATVINDGERLESTSIVLMVFRDDELVDEFPLATNQVMLVGENKYEARYIPENMWEPGTYTFEIVVTAVDPDGQQSIELLNEPLDAEFVVP